MKTFFEVVYLSLFSMPTAFDSLSIIAISSSLLSVASLSYTCSEFTQYLNFVASLFALLYIRVDLYML